MTHRLFFDTNVLLDHLLERDPFADHAMALWSLAERREVVGLISAISFNFIYYIVRHEGDERAARLAVRGLRDVFEVVEVDAQIIAQALDSPVRDFEDAIQYHCAIRGNADCLVTRDLHDFRHAKLPVLAPDAFIASLDA